MYMSVSMCVYFSTMVFNKAVGLMVIRVELQTYSVLPEITAGTERYSQWGSLHYMVGGP